MLKVYFLVVGRSLSLVTIQNMMMCPLVGHVNDTRVNFFIFECQVKQKKGLITVCRCILYFATLFLFLLIVCAAFLLYPSDPEIQLNRIGIWTNMRPILDLSFSLIVKVRNRDLFSLTYDTLVVSVSYCSHLLGFVIGDNSGCIMLEIGGVTWRLSLEPWTSFIFYMPNSLEWHLYWLLCGVLHLSLYHFIYPLCIIMQE